MGYSLGWVLDSGVIFSKLVICCGWKALALCRRIDVAVGFLGLQFSIISVFTVILSVCFPHDSVEYNYDGHH